MILAFIALALQAPQPGEIKTFRDWTVGCDNGRLCQAVALIPEDDWDGYMTMALRRGPEADARAVIAVPSDETAPVAALGAGGKRLPVRLVAGEGEAIVEAADVPRVIETLRTQPALEVHDANGDLLGRVSLAGASAALLYMDDQQKRVGTQSALVRPGAKPASDVPPPPPLPQVRDAAGDRQEALTLPPEREAELRKRFGCEVVEVGGPEGHEAYAIDDRHTLILLPCGAGAYNVRSVPLVATGSPDSPSTRPAEFDLSPSWSEESLPVLVNAGWADGRLVAFAKGRGLGDCGVGNSYAWDGARFRLVEQIEMHECRGSIDYISTWRAEVVR